MLYQYRYIDSKGKKKAGLIDAANVNDAKAKLRLQNVVFFHLQERRNIVFWKKKNRDLSGNHLITFTTQLSQLLKAGVPLYESLLSLEEQYRNESFHPILSHLCDRIKEGSSLSESMSCYPKSFDKLYCAMIAAGESVGALEDTLEKLAVLLARQSKLKKQTMTALIYPLLLFCFSICVVIMLLTFVIPSLEALFEDRNVNRFTKTIMQVSHFLIHGWAYYLPLSGSVVYGCYYFFKSSKGKRLIQKTLLRLPLLKTLIIQTEMTRFTRTMGTLLQGGVSIIKALQISRQVMRNPFLEEVIEKAEKHIIEGSLLSCELKKSPLIPPLVPRMLAIGEEGGNSNVMLHRIADFYEEEVDKVLTRLTALAQPVILIIMGGFVGLIMLAVLLPLTDVSAFL